MSTRYRHASAAALAALLVAAGTPAVVRAQSTSTSGVAGSIETLATENARLYLHPVASGVGATLNSRWFRTARVHKPLQFDVGIVAMGSLVPSSGNSFQPVLPDSLVYQGQVFREPYGTGVGLSTPTAVGAGAGVQIEPQGTFRQYLVTSGVNPASEALDFPKGYDLPAVPMALIEARIGLPLATEVMVRGIPSIKIDTDIGSIDAFGVGLKHEISHWIPGPFPLDLAVEGGIQSVHVGDYLTATAHHVALIASRQLSILTLFGAGTLENSDVKIRYTVQNPNLPQNGLAVNVEDHGEDTARLTGGFSFDFVFLKLTASYSVARYDVVGAGVTFGF